MNIYDISKKTGVSIATVSRVLNNSPHVSEATRRKVLRVIEESGYIPNAFARGLGLNTMKTIGLLCPDATDPYLASAVAYLEREFRLKQYNCILICTGLERAAREAGMEAMRAQHVDGVVLIGSGFVGQEEHENDCLREMAATAPVVLLGAFWDCPNVYSAACDDRQAMQDAVAALVEEGRRRILYLYDSYNDSGRRKLEGFRRGLEAAGLSEANLPPLRLEKGADPIALGMSLADRAAQDGLKFDAVLCSNDMLAVGAVKYARAAGLRVPEDISVVGYNNSVVSLCTYPELSSVDNRLAPLCTNVAATMLGVLEGQEMPQRSLFHGQLIRRGTTLPAP